MIYYILNGHDRKDDIVSMLMMFYPNEKYVLTDKTEEGLTFVSSYDGKCCVSYLYENGELKTEGTADLRNESDTEKKRIIGLSAYIALKKHKDIYMPWGILTGVRPAKLITEMREKGMTEEAIKKELTEGYLVSESKYSLMSSVSRSEEEIVQNGKGKIGIYIGIPFCPTRCLYCSFTAYPLKQYHSRVEDYLCALEKEIKFCAKYVKGKEIESIYIGGGTPTSLNEEQLERLLEAVEGTFPINGEYTVEAGRPDTLNRQKLKILKAHNVNRISINPQTLNDSTLELIGRAHNKKMFIDAFNIAREEGHEHINTDIILGLPSEGEDEVRRTIEGLCRLSPESITVHTLAVKRASRLKETLEKYELPDVRKMDGIITMTAERLKEAGMYPYYMYRQKNMVGNFENVGYCKPGCQCLYNVEIMEEKQSILALGAGGSTKLVNNQTNEIRRIFNVKSVTDYIERIDEMLQRKEVGMEWL